MNYWESGTQKAWLGLILGIFGKQQLNSEPSFDSNAYTHPQPNTLS